ncbi:hypothetical protein EX290_01290 [Enterococcus faecium]|nr:hypothetical protein EA467_05275 [Enterococcus faecium]RAX31252.1 hypothetical protein DQE80_05620 [Enterococcus sp. HPCN18]TXU26770.1 hypothetical protein D4M94_07440 [Enterococcus sp. T0168A.B-11]EGP5092939.1 hypothetical protein [Enterococcus faecium]EGP5120290.1 hypothetical protein [Enterococcus faecium]
MQAFEHRLFRIRGSDKSFFTTLFRCFVPLNALYQNKNKLFLNNGFRSVCSYLCGRVDFIFNSYIFEP